MPEAPRCQHVKSNGIQCGSPALKDKHFCYYHQRCHPIAWNYRDGPYSNYSQSTLTLPVFEDAHSIQITLRHVVEFILQHRIDDKKAGLVLYALQIASSNLKRLESEAPKPDEIVTDPPFDPVREFQEEEERLRQANHAEFERMFPLDPKPADPNPLPAQASDRNVDEDKANNELPPGTIHACIDESQQEDSIGEVPQVCRMPHPNVAFFATSGWDLSAVNRARFSGPHFSRVSLRQPFSPSAPNPPHSRIDKAPASPSQLEPASGWTAELRVPRHFPS
jgi:hypothetical protein